VKHETIQRVATPTAMLVALSDTLAETCTEALGDGGMRVLRVGHVAAASERIPVVMPQLVVVATTMREEELTQLEDRCVAVGADLTRLSPDVPHGQIAADLKGIADRALVKALRGGRV
jgi:hypothetical protein